MVFGKQIVVILTVVISLLAVAAVADEPETLDTLKARAEQAEGGKKAELLADVAEWQLKAATDLFDKGKKEEAVVAVTDCGGFAARAGEAAVSSGKRLKKTEIELRKLARKLEDLARVVEFEHRAPVNAALQRVEDTRTRLLNRMFRK